MVCKRFHDNYGRAMEPSRDKMLMLPLFLSDRRHRYVWGTGRCAKQALRGCIERSVPGRWAVAMADGVTWGIGRGSATDDVTPPSHPEKVVASRSPSRSPVKARKAAVSAVEDRSASRSARAGQRPRFAQPAEASRGRPMRTISTTHSWPPQPRTYPTPHIHSRTSLC